MRAARRPDTRPGTRPGTRQDTRENAREIRQLFLAGQFPVATVDGLAGRDTDEVLGLVVSRGYDSEETFFGMLLRAAAKGAQGIAGYRESVSFHPDGSRFYTCYGTAVRFRQHGLGK